MNQQNLSSFIWSVADLLRGDYKQSEYGKVILPFTVLRRLDCVLEPSKDAVLAEKEKRDAAGLNPEPFLLKKAGLLFYNTLFDENAACHLALGSAYKGNIQGGVEMSSEELAAAGVNESLIHVDFMIGSEEVAIHGVTKDGTKSPIMRDGDWAFEV